MTRLERALWLAWYWMTEPMWAVVRFFRGLNYEPQHVDPWGADAERIYNPEVVQIPFAGLGYTLPLTLPAPRLEPVLSAPRIVGGEHIISDHDHDTDDGCCDVCGEWAGELLLDPKWQHAHWWWYAAERQREADDYHNWIEADRRHWRAENGLAALELAAA